MRLHAVTTWAAIAIGFVSAAAAADELESVRFQTIKLGGFWKQQVKLQTEKWIPHCARQMEQGGKGQELLNLVATGEVLNGRQPSVAFSGCPWSDAYIYNTAEAICLALEVDPEGDAELAKAQAVLRAKLEEWIPIILAAQGPDGYIHSFHTLKKRPRFTAIGDHEFYVMGYFLEMGIAHYRMTGGKDRRLYDAALKCADLLCDTFGPAPKRTWKNGHPGMEHALCRLGEAANASEGQGKGEKYIALAKHFLSHQHEIEPSLYNQSEKPAVEMTEARGHAVRATYFYTAMADVARLTGDSAYLGAADQIWANAIHKKHYLTGGVGASHQGEAFGGDFELSNNAYCESCAGCGLSFWAEQMHRLHLDAHYVDVQERALFNNVLGAVELSGTNFYYQNPLVSKQARYPWHGCPCCVGNIPRTLIAIKDLMYSVNNGRDALYLNHFVDSEGTIPNIGGAALRIRQETRYPWEGAVTVTLHPSASASFTLALRIPDRTESALYKADPETPGQFTVRVNGEAQALKVEQGYARMNRKWQDGDRVELCLPMEVQRVRCDERVAANRGRVAVQRGPLVYNFEDVDQAKPVKQAVLKPDVELKPVWRGDLLGGVMVIEGGGLKAVPNYARLNRGGASQVWMIEDTGIAGVNTLAGRADLTVSFCRAGMDPAAVNDSEMPKTEKDRAVGNFDFWPHKGTAEWLQYEFAKPVEVKACTVSWFDDTGHGECRVPASWRLVYRTGDGKWEPVAGASEYSVTKGTLVEVTFTPVKTSALRLEVQLPPKFSSGVYEWAVTEAVESGAVVTPAAVRVAPDGQLPGLRKLMDTPLRDPSVCVGPDGTYYLTGTSEPFWGFNNESGIRVWKSTDMVKWEPLGTVWRYGESPWHKKYLEAKKPLWAPEIHFLKGTFWLTYSMPGWDGTGKTSGSGLLKSVSGKAEGPYVDMQPSERLGDEIDATLFQEDNGDVYFAWHSGKIAKLKPDLSGLAEPYHWLKAGASDTNKHHHAGLCAKIFGKDSFDHVGFEGMFLFKREGRYYLCCSEQMEGRYSCVVATSSKLLGPYSERSEAIRHGGHNSFFTDPKGQMWSTFFGPPYSERAAVLPVHFDDTGRVLPGN
jgi:DUF1680 family protein